MSWYKNSGTVFVFGTEFTNNPVEEDSCSSLLSAIAGAGNGSIATFPILVGAVGNDE